MVSFLSAETQNTQIHESCIVAQTFVCKKRKQKIQYNNTQRVKQDAMHTSGLISWEILAKAEMFTA